MGKLKFILALWMAKLSIPALKITHHSGTDFPGNLALKICPDFLRYVGRPKTIVAITGTNGKTTVSNMLSDILESNGYRVMSNRAGANVASGIATTFIRSCGLFGRISKYDIAVLEVDERSSVKVYPYVTPDFVAITNLSRDSIMRNAHPDFIAGILTSTIPASTKMILNADDLISCGVAPDNPRVHFGIDRLPTDVTACVNLINDMRICPKCLGKLEYEYLRYHHIGKAVCRDCGFHSPDSEFLARDVDFENHTVTIRENGQDYAYPLITDNVINTYNILTVITTLRQLGLEPEAIRHSLERTVIDTTRYAQEKVGKVTLVKQMSKDLNAMAGSRVFDYISHLPGQKEVYLMMNNMGDAANWSENTCWLYDADFEFLNRDDIVQIVCAGPRALDYKLRLLMAGVPEEKIACDLSEEKAAELLRFTPGDDIYYLYGADAWGLTNRMYDYLKKLALQRAADKEVQQ
ncbi:MAG: DUF1727 domain-containing protein [Clostridiales bacterium]|nr:DUF1727 domain-containing protein [Candidatus Cacconaster stercorequi]